MEYKTIKGLRSVWEGSGVADSREAIEAGIRLGAEEERRAIKANLQRTGNCTLALEFIAKRSARTKSKPGGVGKPKPVTKKKAAK